MIEDRCSRRAFIGILLALGSLIVLAPIWLVRFPPLVDYPNHLARAYILTHLDDPSTHLSDFYGSNWGPFPYLVQDFLLIALQKVFPVDLSSRLFLSCCVVLFPLASWAFLRAANPSGETHAIVCFGCAYNPFFLAGFTSFHLSVGLCFIVLWAWLRFQRNPRWLKVVLVTVLATALYFTHIVGFAVALGVAGLYSLVQKRPLTEKSRWILPFAPGVVFYFIWRQMGGGVTAFYFPTLLDKAKAIFEPARAYSPVVDALTIGGLFLILAVALVLRDVKLNTSWLYIAGALLLVIVFSPDMTGSLLYVRFSPFFLVVALAAFRLEKIKKPFLFVAAAILIVRTLSVATYFQRVQADMVSMESAIEVIPPHSRVLPVVGSYGEPLMRRYYAHFWAYGVIRRQWYSPYLFHAEGILPQPLKLLVNAYAPKGFGGLEYRTPIDWTQVRRDYNYVWFYNVPQFSSELRANGDQIFSGPRIEVYRLNKGLSNSPAPLPIAHQFRK